MSQSPAASNAQDNQDVRSLRTIYTPDGVALTIELAGVPARLVAYLLDSWLILGTLLLLIAVIGLVANMFASALAAAFKEYDWSWVSSETMGIVVPFLIFSFFLLCFVLQEWLWQGRTIGKALLRIRVVRNNGQPIGFWESFGRNLFRMIDVLLSAVGVLVMLFSPSEKRLGDYLVGTMVIVDVSSVRQDWVRRSLGQLIDSGPHSASATEQAADTTKILTYEERAILESFSERAKTKRLSPSAQNLLDYLLRQYFAWRLQVPDAEADNTEFLDKLRSV